MPLSHFTYLRQTLITEQSSRIDFVGTLIAIFGDYDENTTLHLQLLCDLNFSLSEESRNPVKNINKHLSIAFETPLRKCSKL